MASGYSRSHLFGALILSLRGVSIDLQVNMVKYRKRFFSIFNIRESKHGTMLAIHEIVFVIILIAVTVGIYFGNVGIGTLI